MKTTKAIERFRYLIYIVIALAFLCSGMYKCPLAFGWPPDLVPHPHLPEPNPGGNDA